MSDTYPLAPNGIFLSVQGEGHLSGIPMVFVRLAGCSVKCEKCDTDFSVSERLSPEDIARRVCDLLHAYPSVEWLWLTGGEPTDHDLPTLRAALARIPHPTLRLALATSGHKKIEGRTGHPRWDWISVSPHDPAKWVEKYGSELKLVPALNGFRLADFEAALARDVFFSHYFVQPCEGVEETKAECVAWALKRSGWRVCGQLHKYLGIP